MRILIADDDAVSVILLKETLAGLGHQVLAARDGREAWEAIERQEPQVIVSDWTMPEIDGLELCRKVRARRGGKYIYYILLTMHGGRQDYLDGMAAGVDDFLVKPFDPDQLAARLRVAERILHLQTEVRQLEGLLPVCSVCKKIRDEGDRWVPIDSYISEKTTAVFSHGYCPECYRVAEAEARAASST